MMKDSNRKLLTSALLVLLMAGLSSALTVGTQYSSTTDFESNLVSSSNVVIQSGSVLVNNTGSEGTITFDLDMESKVDSKDLSADNFGLANSITETDSNGETQGNSVTVRFLNSNGETVDSATLSSSTVDIPSEDVTQVEFVLEGEASLDSFQVKEVSNYFGLGEIVNHPMTVSDNGEIRPTDSSPNVRRYGYGKWVLLENKSGTLERVDESSWQELTMDGSGEVELNSETLAQGFLQPSPFERHFDEPGDYAYSLVLAEAESRYEHEGRDIDGDGTTGEGWIDPDGQSSYTLYGEDVQEEAGQYDISIVNKKTYKFHVRDTPEPSSPTTELQKFFNDIMRGLYNVV